MIKKTRTPIIMLGTFLLFLNSGSQEIIPQLWAQEEPNPAEDQFNQDTKAKMEKRRRDEAFQQLKDDANKLSRAVEELKEMIEKSNKNTFSLQILKKTDEVEKILKDVRRRAKEGA